MFRLHNNGIDMNFFFNFMLLIQLAEFLGRLEVHHPLEKCKANALRLSNVTLSPELRRADTCNLAEKTGEIGSFGKTETFGNLGH